MSLKSILRSKILLLLIVSFAFFLRIYGLDWDQGQHLHPDERFLTMVTNDIKIPTSFFDYLNPKTSTLSPYNNNYSFFVYGTFPINLTKIISILTNNDNYGKINLVGRFLSALFEVGIVILLYKISLLIFSNRVGLLAAYLYSITVLSIQLSHFYAVDTFLNFFLVWSFYLLVKIILKPKFYFFLLIGLSFGTALACKINAVLFFPIISLGFLYSFIKYELIKKTKNKYSAKIFIFGIPFFVLMFYLTFRISQPQAFFNANFLTLKINPQFLSNIKELQRQGAPDSTFPPAVQWISTLPVIFPLKNMVLWGMGLPLGILCVVSYLISFFSIIKKTLLFVKNNIISEPDKLIINFLIFLWISGLFFYESFQFAKTIRYFIFIYPFLILFSSKTLMDIYVFIKHKSSVSAIITFALFLPLITVYPVSFMHIYTKPITRVLASEWIYNNVPAAATFLIEEWDDGLPLYLSGHSPGQYKFNPVFMYDLDTPEKWLRINPKVQASDYIVISSNRAYGSTMKLPKKYPQTIEYYLSLFNGTGNFVKVAEFVSRPCFPPFGKDLFCFNDDNSEESFTVYDHPKVMIFKKK